MFSRVFYTIEDLTKEQRFSLLDEMLPMSHLVTFDEERTDQFGSPRKAVEKKVGIEKLRRSPSIIWQFLHERLSVAVVDYELYARYEDPCIKGNELFMHVRTGERIGKHLIKKYSMHPKF